MQNNMKLVYSQIAGLHPGRLGRGVDLVERSLEVVRLRVGARLLEGLLVIDPARVNGIHQDAARRELLRARARHHV